MGCVERSFIAHLVRLQQVSGIVASLIIGRGLVCAVGVLRCSRSALFLSGQTLAELRDNRSHVFSS